MQWCFHSGLLFVRCRDCLDFFGMDFAGEVREGDVRPVRLEPGLDGPKIDVAECDTSCSLQVPPNQEVA